MTIQLKNNAVGFLSAGISATATLLVLQSGEGAKFPALVPSQFFYVTLASTSGATEIVKVTGRSGDSMTVQRAQENTTAMSFPALSRVELRVTAQAVYDVIDAAISGTTTAVSNIASVIAVAASIDSVNTVTSNLASVINVSNNIGDINLVENSLTNVNAVAANMADVNAVADDLAAVNAVADDIDDLVTNLEDIVAVGGSINSVVTVANNIASVNAVNSNSTNVNTVAGSIGNVNTVATNIAAVQTVSTNIASVNAVNSNSANVNTVAGSIANVNTTATNIASVNTAATNIVAIQTAPAQATAAANSASAAATSATNAAASATAAAASAVTAVNAPGTSGTSTTSLTIGTGSQTFTTQTGKAWVVGQFVTVASTASPTNFMYGQITAYNSGTGSMTVNVLSIGGSGTLASWTIGLGGPNSTLTDQNSLQPVTLTLPSIRPSLLLDFANSKKLDPRITFTRATSGTYYDGVTSAKAEENLLLRSQDFSATWTLANLTAGSAVTAPDATGTATPFTASAANGTLTQSVTAVAGDHTFSVWLRRVSGTGNVDITAHSGGTWVTQTITSTWARYTVTQTLTAGARTPGVRVVTSGDQIEVWGAQLEQRSAATAYTPTTTQAITNYVPQLLTAPANTPRFDHNPTTGESLGLLVEEQRTNLALRSQEFNFWTVLRASITTNTTVAPDGTLTADRFIASTDANSHLVYYQYVSGFTTPMFSVYAKAAGLRYLGMSIESNTTGRACFDLLNGTVEANWAAGASIQSVGNGWYRCSMLWNTNLADTYVYLYPSFAGSANPSTAAGNNWDGFFIWGAQIEAGAFPTSYIPTTSASVTRTADYVEAFGDQLARWFSPVDATFFVDWVTQGESGAASGSTPVGLGHPTNNDMFVGLLMYDNRTTVGFTSPNNTSYKQNMTGQRVKGAVSYSSLLFGGSGIDSALDGTVYAGEGASITNSPTILARLRFMCGARSGTEQHRLPGWLRKVAYYPKRLTNAQLQALTA